MHQHFKLSNTSVVVRHNILIEAEVVMRGVGFIEKKKRRKPGRNRLQCLRIWCYKISGRIKDGEEKEKLRKIT